MNIGFLILMIVGGAAGLFSTLYILISLPYMIIKKSTEKQNTAFLFLIRCRFSVKRKIRRSRGALLLSSPVPADFSFYLLIYISIYISYTRPAVLSSSCLFASLIADSSSSVTLSSLHFETSF